MTSFALLTPPAAEPVLLADAKQQARIDTTADDTLVTALITGARQWAEKYTGRAFITQTWQMALDLWPGAVEKWWDGVRQGPITGLDKVNYISLPRAPLQSVASVTYYDDGDNATLWDSGNYFVDTVREPGRLALRMGAVWPVPTRLTNGIVIQYVAGYGDDGTAVPEPIKTAIRQLVAHWYEHRGDAATAPSARGGTVIMPAVPVPLVIEALLDPYRIRYSGA
ncbi:MAG: head-tail connector protein [Alphaproteobacteria bacterium]|nr:head-tail connector protein [Alphaproteobacteria bacterium]